MQLFNTLSVVIALVCASCVKGAAVDMDNVNIAARQVDCSSYGEYEPYTGPCETTNCGASGRDCRADGFSGCVGFPNVQCPFKGCACTNF